MVISELVREEAAVGDRDAAQSRLAVISPLPVIGATPEVARLARALVDAKAVPERAAQDAVHIAIACRAPGAFRRDMEFPATSRTPRRGHGSRPGVETPVSTRRSCARRTSLS